MRKSDTETIAQALEILARDIQAPDDVPRLCLLEAAERLRELEKAKGVHVAMESPKNVGYYWIQANVVKGGQPDVVKVTIDEYSRLTAQACGVEREFVEDELLDATWSTRLVPPAGLVELGFLEGIPF